MESIYFKWTVRSCNAEPPICKTFFHQHSTNSPAMSLLWQSTHSKLLANSIKFPPHFLPSNRNSSHLSVSAPVASLGASFPVLAQPLHILSASVDTTPYFAILWRKQAIIFMEGLSPFSVARTLQLCVWIPLEAWLSVCVYCVLVLFCM
jgi:hypothetical protein